MNEDKLRRVYTGVLNNHMTGMEKNELKGYIKGDQNFSYGFHTNGQRMYFPVRQKWMNNEEYKEYVNGLQKRA